MSRALAVLLAPVILTQAARLRRATPLLPEPPGDRLGGKGGLRLVVVGDSTAVGTGAGSPKDALPGRLGKLLGARWRTVGANGATAAEVLRDHIDDAAGGPTDVAVLVVGWNDAMKLRSGRAFARDLEQLIDRLRTASPDARLVLVAPPVFRDFAVLPHPLREALGAHAAGLTRIARRVAGERGVAIAPGFDGRTVAADGFHPDSAGYARMAAGVAEVLGA
jgi:lysophospholipase L1-like esterase